MATNIKYLWAVVLLVLVGMGLRAYELGAMLDMTNLDEAYYGLDAVSLLNNPRLTPFFPQNFGRESLWMYWVAPFLAIFNPTSFGLRLPALFAGLVALPAMYALVRQMFSRRIAFWAVACLAVLYWHVHLTHISWRVILFPTIGILAWAVVWRAHAKNTLGLWISGGLLMGVLGYTYFSARTWLAVYAVMLVWWFITQAHQRKGILWAGIVTMLTLTPLILYTLTTVEASTRANQVLVTDPVQVLQNALAWLPMWFIQGPLDEIHGVVGRPILDIGLTILLFAGIIGFWSWCKHRDLLLWWVLTVGASLAPAVLSDDATHLRRSFGLILPLVMLLGVGAWWLEIRLRRLRVPSAMAIGALVLLLGVSGVITATDFSRWARSGKAYTLMDQFFYRMITHLETEAPPNVPIYFSPYAYNHPVYNFLKWKIGNRPQGTFEAYDCLVLPNAETVLYASSALYDLPLNQQIAPFVDEVTLWHAEADYPDDAPRYAVYQASPRAELFEGWDNAGTFENGAQMRFINDATLAAKAGEVVWLNVAWRSDAPQDRALSFFAHVYGNPTPYEGGALWAQTDGGICLSHPPFVWRNDEVMVQFVGVQLPQDLPIGDYDIAIGVYDTLTLERIGVLSPLQPNAYIVGATLRVE